jgi:hypothetical protein
MFVLFRGSSKSSPFLRMVWSGSFWVVDHGVDGWVEEG